MDAYPHHVDQKPAGMNLRILLVEDDPDTAASLAMILQGSGHEVHVCATGQAALEVAKETPPDVMLLDIGLRGDMTGWEVARLVQEQPGEKKPLLVAITGYGDEEDLRRSEEIGIHLHLMKPVELDELQKLLERFQLIIAEPAACPPG